MNPKTSRCLGNLNATTIRDEGFSLQAVGILNHSPVEPSIDGDDGIDFDDEGRVTTPGEFFWTTTIPT